MLALVQQQLGISTAAAALSRQPDGAKRTSSGGFWETLHRGPCSDSPNQKRRVERGGLLADDSAGGSPLRIPRPVKRDRSSGSSARSAEPRQKDRVVSQELHQHDLQHDIPVTADLSPDHHPAKRPHRFGDQPLAIPSLPKDALFLDDVRSDDEGRPFSLSRASKGLGLREGTEGGWMRGLEEEEEEQPVHWQRRRQQEQLSTEPNEMLHDLLQESSRVLWDSPLQHGSLMASLHADEEDGLTPRPPQRASSQRSHPSDSVMQALERADGEGEL